MQILKYFSTTPDQNKTFLIKASYGKQRKTFLWPVDLGTVTLDTMKLPILEVFQFSQDTKMADLTLRFSKGKERHCELGLEDEITFRRYLKFCALQGFSSLKV